MTSLTDLIAVSRAFADLADHVDPDAPVRSDIWPTAAHMIDHLGNVQAWATQVVRHGVAVDRQEYRRPPGLPRVEWFRATSDALVETLRSASPGRSCWTLWGAKPVASFWSRRMTNECAKHLWDLRTADSPDPVLPEEVGVDTRVGVMEEFVEVLVPAARERGIEPLPRDVLLVADDAERSWRFSRDWEVTATSLFDRVATGDADVLRADVGDVILFIWQRATPWDQPARFQVVGDGAALRAFSRTSIHL